MLTPAERREKKLTKLVGEQGSDTLVAVYKVCPRQICHAPSVGRRTVEIAVYHMWASQYRWLSNS